MNKSLALISAEELPRFLSRGEMGFRECRTFALRAEIKMRAAVLEIEIESELLGHDLEVIHLHLRRELLAGMRTPALR